MGALRPLMTRILWRQRMDLSGICECYAVVVIDLWWVSGAHCPVVFVLGSGIGLSVMLALDGHSLYTVVRWILMVDRYWVCHACTVLLHNLTLHHIVVYDGQ